MAFAAKTILIFLCAFVVHYLSLAANAYKQRVLEVFRSCPWSTSWKVRSASSCRRKPIKGEQFIRLNATQPILVVRDPKKLSCQSEPERGTLRKG